MMKPDASDARNMMALAISSGVPTAPYRLMIVDEFHVVLIGMDFSTSVESAPGETALAVIPYLPNSRSGAGQRHQRGFRLHIGAEIVPAT